MTLQSAIDEYLTTRMAYDEAHAISSARHAEYQSAKTSLVEAMTAEEKQAVKFGEGRLTGMNFFLKSRFSISCTEKNEEETKTWLHDQFGDVNEFTTEKVHKKTVEERLKTDIEGGLLDEFDVPDCMNLKTRPDVTCTGYKQFAQEQRN